MRGEAPISRDEVLVIMGVLADINVITREIRGLLVDEDDEEEEED